MKSKHVLLFSAAAFGPLMAVPALLPPTPAAPAPRDHDQVEFSIHKIYWEYNASANDLGVHVFIDGEDWTKLEIENPREKRIFQVKGKGPYGDLGMTELFFEGAEPSLDEFPLADLLALFPEGAYEISGRTADGAEIESDAHFTYAIPDGPNVGTEVGGNDLLRIHWSEVTSTPPGFPNRAIHIVGYQVIVETFQVTLPASARSVTVPPEYVQALGPGEHLFEVLAIEESDNQTLTEGSFQL